VTKEKQLANHGRKNNFQNIRRTKHFSKIFFASVSEKFSARRKMKKENFFQKKSGEKKISFNKKKLDNIF